MKRGPDAAALLARAVIASAARGRCAVTVAASDSVPWASATFAGARHSLTLSAAPGPVLDAWLAALPEADLPIAGHLVADIVVIDVAREPGAATVAVEALTVEER